MIMKKNIWLLFLSLSFLWTVNSCKEDDPVDPGKIELAGIKVGNVELDLVNTNTDIPVDSVIFIMFRSQLDSVSAKSGILLQRSDNTTVGFKMTFIDNNITVKLILDEVLENQTSFILKLSSAIKGSEGEVFSGTQVAFSTVNGVLVIETITLNGIDFKVPYHPIDVDLENIGLEVTFSEPIDTVGYKVYFDIAGNVPISVSVSNDLTKVSVNNIDDLDYYRKIYFSINNGLKSVDGYPFAGFNNYFYSSLDSTYKFPEVTDEELLDIVQAQTFKFFYDYAHPVSGMTRERYGSGDIVTTGGSGFGVMALIVGISRNFIIKGTGT